MPKNVNHIAASGFLEKAQLVKLRLKDLHKIEIEMHEDCIITFHHELGEKWSIFLRHFISQFVENTVGVVPKVKTTNSLIVVRVHMPP